MFATGEGILTQKDCVTPDGLQEVFTTNLFGHFLLVSDAILATELSSSIIYITNNLIQNHVSFSFLQGE